MRKLIGSFAAMVLCSACADGADDCYNTATCPLPPDAGPTVIYVTPDAGLCDGVCAVRGTESNGWTKDPFLLAQTKAKALPAKPCPQTAPHFGVQVYAMPDPNLACPACSCAPPTGECLLPDTVTASPSPACPSDGDAGVPFNPPSAWDGGCTTNEAISYMNCDGGTCIQSVTAGSLTLTESCAPVPPPVPQDVTWVDSAYTCEGDANGTCPDAGNVCVPKAPEGFTVCISREDDDDFYKCPPDYPARYPYYRGATDGRMCAPCTCEPPEGSTCSSLVTFYTDDTCAEQIASVTATTASAMCAEIPPGSPLASKQASPPLYTPGSCKPSGGGQVGSVQPNHPITFCCQQ